MIPEFKNKCTRGFSDYAKLDLHSRCVCNRDLSNKVAVVTGANGAIGREVCAELADRGARVLMACRDRDRAQEALMKLKAENPLRDLEIEIIDISNMQSIREFAQRMYANYTAIDILINNAGIFTRSILTPGRLEVHFVTNYLGHFFLTNLLLNLLKESDDARIVNVSCSVHRIGRYHPSSLKKRMRSKLMAYANSKLCLILFTKELSRRLKETNISAFAVHPGIAATAIYETEQRSLETKIMKLPSNTAVGKTLTKTPRQAAQTILHAVLNKHLPSQSGAYLAECAVASSSIASRNMDNALRLWNLSAKYTGMEGTGEVEPTGWRRTLLEAIFGRVRRRRQWRFLGYGILR